MRIYKTYDLWECYKNGFYNESELDEQVIYAIMLDFFSNEQQFKQAIDIIFKEWINSCEHNLTNENKNRIAWIGQASLCKAKGISSLYKYLFNDLPSEIQLKANNIALIKLNEWLLSHDLPLSNDGLNKQKGGEQY